MNVITITAASWSLLLNFMKKYMTLCYRFKCVILFVYILCAMLLVVSALASSPPSSPTIVSTTPQSTSITITWTQPEGDVVDSYEITYSYQGPCPVVIQFDSGSISGNRRQFTAVDLHGFSNYTIIIIASNGAGKSPPVTTTVETLTAGMMYYIHAYLYVQPNFYQTHTIYIYMYYVYKECGSLR